VPIQIKRSSTTNVVPNPADLFVGELALNTADAKLWTKHSDGSLVILNSANNSWTYFATTWSEPPVFNSSISGGSVYNYVLNGITRYRFVPTTYNPTQDSFYTNFSVGVLTGLIASRG
jgi:hypothetical protein